jgi:hypothetical protein
MRTIAFDIKLRRPGCALIQSVMGSTVTPAELELHFGSETWVTSMTNSMRLMPVTDEQYAMCIDMAKRSIVK